MANKATMQDFRILMDLLDRYIGMFEQYAKLPEEDIEALNADVIRECTALLRKSLAEKKDYLAECYGVHKFVGLPDLILD